jgi:hypothetical protein
MLTVRNVQSAYARCTSARIPPTAPSCRQRVGNHSKEKEKALQQTSEGFHRIPLREASVLLISLAKGLVLFSGYDVRVMVIKLMSSMAATINKRSLFTLFVITIALI